MKVDDEMYYIINDQIPTSMIILQPNRISIATATTMVLNISEEKMWLGEYFVDTSRNSDTTNIKGTNLTLSRATAESLVRLLDENGTNWWTLRLSRKVASH